ncbi:MAG: ATP-binding protein [Treponema sp.]|nr:ATP-binding protein [Treponema sp.]
MNIVRKKYLTLLKNRMHNGLIKVVTGIRRCGKSYLLFSLFYDFLKENGVTEDRIIRIALDDDMNEPLRDTAKLSAHIRSRILDAHKTYYILLDEIQFAISDEEYRHPEKPLKIYSVLNGLLRLPNVDIYVTGSNSKFLSSDVLTEFRGRGDEVHILPFSFSEYVQGYDGDIYHAWADYIVYGGLPLVLGMKTDEQKASYLTHLFSETYLKDIIARNNIEKTQELEDVINILASSTGSLTNPTRVLQTFKSVLHSPISINTLINYFEYLKDAFIISEVNRYDVKGRKYIGSPNKYYFEDVGLRNARLHFRQIEEPHLMENVLYNELRYRGFAVDVGIVEKRARNDTGQQKRVQYEIDFVATQGSKKYYIQSALSVAQADKAAQEKKSLQHVHDSFKKIIIVKDVIKPYHDDDGIAYLGLFDFLQDENGLEG